jgi:hypothetical protein
MQYSDITLEYITKAFFEGTIDKSEGLVGSEECESVIDLL